MKLLNEIQFYNQNDATLCKFRNYCIMPPNLLMNHRNNFSDLRIQSEVVSKNTVLIWSECRHKTNLATISYRFHSGNS